MTTFERFERSIPELMTELAPARVPDYFDDMLRQTASQRQRPAWSYPERWLPVDIAVPQISPRTFPWRPLIVAVLTALLIAAGLVVYIGSRPRVPPPFGVADNGVLLYRAADGAVVSVDPMTGRESTLAFAGERRGEPIPSRDGRLVAYIPRSDAGAPIIVSRIDGSASTPLAGEYQGIEAVDWSPDAKEVAFVSFDGIRKSITIAAVDGSTARTLPFELDVWRMRYLPDGRLAITAAEEPGGACPGEDCALFVIGPDGTALEPLIAAADFHGLSIDVSPDGTKLVWVEWSIGAGTVEEPDAPGRLHVFDLTTHVDRRVPVAGPIEYAINRASFSPDGASILIDLYEIDGDHWAVVPATGGSPVRLGPEWPGGTDAAWAPDSRSVLARFETSSTTSELWMLDATGGGGDRRLEVEVPYLPAWQRVGS
jgi:dipeptidyl aminopeptidase/acylaminoacyl peptidase